MKKLKLKTHKGAQKRFKKTASGTATYLTLIGRKSSCTLLKVKRE